MGPNPTLVEIVVDAVAKTTGLVAAVAGLLVVLSGRRELKKWSRQKLVEKKAEAAGAGLVAALDVLDAMELATTPAGIKGDPEREKEQEYWAFMRIWFIGRIERIVNPKMDALQRARTQAHVFLNEEQNTVLEAVASHVNTVVGSAVAWTTYLEGGARFHEEGVGEYRKAFGTEPAAARQGLRKQVTAALRDAAQFKDS